MVFEIWREGIKTERARMWWEKERPWQWNGIRVWIGTKESFVNIRIRKDIIVYREYYFSSIWFDLVWFSILEPKIKSIGFCIKKLEKKTIFLVFNRFLVFQFGVLGFYRFGSVINTSNVPQLFYTIHRQIGK